MTDRILMAHLTRGVHVYSHEHGYTVEWYEEGVDGCLFVRSASFEEEDHDQQPIALRKALLCITEHVGEPGDYQGMGERLFNEPRVVSCPFEDDCDDAVKCKEGTDED